MKGEGGIEGDDGGDRRRDEGEGNNGMQERRGESGRLELA